MEKNYYLMINDFIFDLYSWNTTEDIDDTFFQRLKMIVPFSYASLFLHNDNANNAYALSSPICYPEAFSEAESSYMDQADYDYLLWILHAKEPNIVRESDMLDEQHRLSSPLYKKCYRKFNIFDSMQLTIVYQQKLYGVLSLFRTRVDGVFTTDDMFYLKSIGTHLNAILYKLIESKASRLITPNSLHLLQKQYGLTAKESEILERLFAFQDNKEIADALNIRENTLQKHLQNLFRKLNVSSRWELLRTLLSQ